MCEHMWLGGGRLVPALVANMPPQVMYIAFLGKIMSSV